AISVRSTLSLHDALPISVSDQPRIEIARNAVELPALRTSRPSDDAESGRRAIAGASASASGCPRRSRRGAQTAGQMGPQPLAHRSEEHTSELQSHLNLVC